MVGTLRDVTAEVARKAELRSASRTLELLAKAAGVVFRFGVSIKGIERMTKQKIADGDTLGFDPTTVEAEKPEVRERPDVSGGRGRGPREGRLNT